MPDLITATFFAILAAGFLVGVVVGLTGMGGGALMTPALIFLGVGDAATVVTADLTAAAVYKTGGAIVHGREGSPHIQLAKWLILGSVPMALLGPHLVAWFVDPEDLDSTLKLCIGFALLFAAATYALRLYINLVRRVRGRGAHAPADPLVRPIPTLLVGALGGLLVGITSVGSGSVIFMAYEIWEMQTGNLVASFSHERDALGLVRDAVQAHGAGYVETLALVSEDEDGSSTTVATSYELIQRASAPQNTRSRCRRSRVTRCATADRGRRGCRRRAG